MKRTSKNVATIAMVALCGALVYGVKAGNQYGPTQTPTPTPNARDTSRDEKTAENAPARFNRASGIVGMEVRNQSDEHLGHIKDVVFDLRTERVSYAVMTTSPKGLFGINEKLLALPLNALTASSDEKHLILNAEKSKVEAAMGFDHHNWPSVISPSWGAQPFWQQNSDKPSSTDRPDATAPLTPRQEQKPDQKPDRPLDQK